MVFTSLPRLLRCPGPDEFWRKRKILKLAAHFYGRRRNCYGIAIRGVHRALMFATFGRKLKKQDMKEIWELRADAGAQEHGIDFDKLNEGLTRCNIFLNRKSLADLAIWEPRTFKALTDIALARTKQDGVKAVANKPLPDTIITDGLIK